MTEIDDYIEICRPDRTIELMRVIAPMEGCG